MQWVVIRIIKLLLFYGNSLIHNMQKIKFNVNSIKRIASLNKSWVNLIRIFLEIFGIVYPILISLFDVINPQHIFYKGLHTILNVISVLGIGILTNELFEYLSNSSHHPKENGLDQNINTTPDTHNNNIWTIFNSNRIFLVFFCIIMFMSIMLSAYQSYRAQRNFALTQVAETKAQAAQKAAEIERNLAATQTRLAASRELVNQDIVEYLKELKPDPLEQGDIFTKIGQIHQSQGQFEDALLFHKQAFDAYQDTINKIGSRISLNNIGSVYYKEGSLDTAKEYFQKAYEMQEEIDDPFGDATTFNNLGLLYQNYGEYERAFRHYFDALDIYVELDDRQGEGLTRNYIGSVYQELGKYTEAYNEYQNALQLFQEINDTNEIAKTFSFLGLIDFFNDQYDSAMEYQEKALNIYENVNETANIGIIQSYIADIHQLKGDFQDALNGYEVALRNLEQTNNYYEIGRTLNSIGDMYKKQQKYDEAFENYNLAIENYDKSNDSLKKAYTLMAIGEIHESNGDTAHAINSYIKSVELIEKFYGSIKIEDLKSSFINKFLVTYDQLISLLWQEKRFPEAFHYAELASSRVLLNQVGSPKIDFRRGADIELRNEETDLRNFGRPLFTDDSQDLRPDPFQQTRMVNQEFYYEKYEELLNNYKLSSPEFKAKSEVKTISLDEVKEEILDDDSTLIKFFILRQKILVWIITKTEINTVEINIDEKTLENKVDYFFSTLTTRTPHQDASMELYRSLFKPLESYITNNNLIIIPHSVLHHLPFAALMNEKNNQYIIENYAISVAPSASTLKYISLKQNQNDRRILGLGNVRKNAREEVNMVVDFYNSSPLTGKSATEKQVFERGNVVDILHISTIAKTIPGHPLFNYLELSSDNEYDGRLSIYEIYDLNLANINLVVLSASNTGIGMVTPSDDIISFDRAFLSAGSPAVVSTLWDVDDTASENLMKSFYQNLQNRVSTAEALRQAQNDMIKMETYNHPYFWAAYVLTGDYK